MSKSLNDASYDLGNIHTWQDKVVMFFIRRKLIFLGSKNLWTSPKRDSKHLLGFCTESSSFSPLAIWGETGEEDEMYEILWWNHPLPALILTLWTSEEYCSSQQREGENKNCSVIYELLASEKGGRETGEKHQFFVYRYEQLPTIRVLCNVFFSKCSMTLFLQFCFSWTHCQL